MPSRSFGWKDNWIGVISLEAKALGEKTILFPRPEKSSLATGTQLGKASDGNSGGPKFLRNRLINLFSIYQWLWMTVKCVM